MATTYTLLMQIEPPELEESAERVARRIGGRRKVLPRATVIYRDDHALHVGLGPVDPRMLEFMMEDYGIQACSSVSFKLDPDERDRGRDLMLEAVGELFNVSSGDFLLLFNGELPVLNRTGGVITVEEQYLPLTDQRRRALGIDKT